MAKHIQIQCHEPMAIDKTYRQPWADVWLQFTAKPARKKYKLAPTLISRPALERDLEIDVACQKENPDLDYSAGIQRHRKILEYLTNGGDIYIDIESIEKDMPNIYTTREYIDRTEAERMLNVFLRSLGYNSVQYKWIRPMIIITPV
jgi:hypothetical protein